MNRPFATLSSRIAWSCPWYRVRQDEIRLPDGSAGVYHVVEKPPAAWIVPVTADGQIVLIRHYRYTVDAWCLEVPAGSLEDGQTLEETAATELRQEVGGVASGWEYVGQFYTANGICNEVSHVFLATGVTLHRPDHELTEAMETLLLPIDEVLRRARANEISDGPSALALLLCESRLLAQARDILAR